MGIGAGAQQGPDGIAWKQNKDYELLLARLNDSQQISASDIAVEEESKEEVQRGEKRKWYDGMDSNEVEEKDERQKRKRAKKERKERKAQGKEEKRRRKEEKKKRKSVGDSGASIDNEATTSSLAVKLAAPSPRSMPCVSFFLAATQITKDTIISHRARFLKSKRLAAVSSTAMAEILGVSGSSTPISSSVSGLSTPLPSSSSTSTPAPGAVPETIHELKTSTKSVADYFKDKLALRSRPSSAPIDTDRPTQEYNAATSGDADTGAGRIGLGMRQGIASRFESLGLGFTSGMGFSAKSFMAVSSTSRLLSLPDAEGDCEDNVSRQAKEDNDKRPSDPQEQGSTEVVDEKRKKKRSKERRKT